ncbi:hypothetical protein Tco_1395360 [Tanacetum coccineum]
MPPPDTKARTSSTSPIPKCQKQYIATVVQLGPGINLGARLTCLSFLSSDTQGILIVIGLDPAYLIRYGILLKHFDCAIEMEISLYLCQLARNIAEKSQLLINTFAKPIEVGFLRKDEVINALDYLHVKFFCSHKT